jgi:hypothetical protein
MLEVGQYDDHSVPLRCIGQFLERRLLTPLKILSRLPQTASLRNSKGVSSSERSLGLMGRFASNLDSRSAIVTSRNRVILVERTESVRSDHYGEFRLPNFINMSSAKMQEQSYF